jgi:NodT family efflux transporter outer membrane factor (OMF) lipoprotein
MENCAQPLERLLFRASSRLTAIRPMTPLRYKGCNAVLAAGTIVAGACLLASCAVGPDFQAPEAPHTTGFVPPGELPPATTATPLPAGTAQHFVDDLDIQGQWWTLFQSPELNSLIERGLANNPTLEAASAALRQARETFEAGHGAYWPAVSGSIGVQRDKVSGAALGVPQAGSVIYTLNSASLNVSYTLDAFGGVRRQVEALGAQTEYQQFALEAAYLSLTANLVTAAITEASLRAQLAATQDIADAQQKQLDITERRLKAGGASRVDVLQQQAILQSTLAGLPALRTGLAQQRNLVAAYVGSLPADYVGPEFNLDSLTLPADLPVSIPSKFVEQRPDIREFSALLHQATAEVGVATANMLPQITLSANYGGEAGSFSDVFTPAAVVWGLAGSLTQPIFKGGQLKHQRRAAIAAADEAAANYRATVITAFQNVSDTLLALRGDADVLAAQAEAARVAADSLALVQAQYKSGAASYLQVLSAQQSYQSAAIALVRARAQRYADTAALFQALGGGWWNRSDVAANTQ